MISPETRSRQEPIVLVFVADDNYTILLAVALQSVLVNLERGCSLYLYIIDGGISQINKARLMRILAADHIDFHLEWVVPDMTSLRNLKIHGTKTTAIYLDLLIPDIVSQRFDKAIFLDCDVQVEVSLTKLWQEKSDDCALLAVQSFVTPYVSSPGGLSNYQDFGYEPETPYFNSGVLLLNLKRWRSEKISQKVFDYLHRYRKYQSLHDQYGLNAVLANDWGMLDPKWNVMATVLSSVREDIQTRREELLNHGYIYHFTGPKPWQPNCKHPAKAQWHRYLEESLWFNPGEQKYPIVVFKLDIAIQEILAVIPSKGRFILIDENVFSSGSFKECHALSL